MLKYIDCSMFSCTANTIVNEPSNNTANNRAYKSTKFKKINN